MIECLHCDPGVDWYNGDELNKAVHKYHDQHACQSPQFEQAQLHLRVLEEISKYVTDGQSKVFYHLESIEDAGTASDGLEFLVHFIIVSTVFADSYVIINE